MDGQVLVMIASIAKVEMNIRVSPLPRALLSPSWNTLPLTAKYRSDVFYFTSSSVLYAFMVVCFPNQPTYYIVFIQLFPYHSINLLAPYSSLHIFFRSTNSIPCYMH